MVTLHFLCMVTLHYLCFSHQHAHPLHVSLYHTLLFLFFKLFSLFVAYSLTCLGALYFILSLTHKRFVSKSHSIQADSGSCSPATTDVLLSSLLRTANLADGAVDVLHAVPKVRVSHACSSTVFAGLVVSGVRTAKAGGSGG